MRISGFEWTDEIIEHIVRHSVTPEDVEEACYIQPYFLKGRKPRYYVLGKTESGRYLTIILEKRPLNKVKVITARDMSDAERRRYLKR